MTHPWAIKSFHALLLYLGSLPPEVDRLKAAAAILDAKTQVDRMGQW